VHAHAGQGRATYLTTSAHKAAGLQKGTWIMIPPACVQLGVTTLYKFWAYPDTARIRLSQILVLPPYR
jgi:hypothetical protein